MLPEPKYTCPIIDTGIATVESILEDMIYDFESGYENSFHPQVFKELRDACARATSNIIDELEAVREANKGLRDWGQSIEGDYQEMEKRAEELEEENERLNETVEELRETIAEFKEELDELLNPTEEVQPNVAAM